MTNFEPIIPISFRQVIKEDELKQIIYVLPIDPRKNRIMLSSSLKEDEDKKWTLPKAEVNRYDHQEPIVNLEAFEQLGIKGTIIGVVGSYYESNKKGDLKSHIKVYELQIDELIKKWPGKKKRDRRWFTYDEAMTIFTNKPYLIEAISMSSLSRAI